MAPISLAEQIRAGKRELGQRKTVYPRLVSKGMMTQEEADYQIACAEAWIVTLMQCLGQEHAANQRPLFGG
jgi:hypothetical protein